MRAFILCLVPTFLLGLVPAAAIAQNPAKDRFQLKDVFDLEFASDPQISPDGSRIVYVRNFFDIMTDRQRSNLWIINADGSEHRPLTTGNRNDVSPRWSPDGKRLIYVAKADKSAQIFCRWMDSGETAQLSRLTSAPSGLAWSPDGKQIAFSMFVPEKAKPFVKLPEKPKGAEWAAPPKVIRKVNYRFDGRGYLKDGYYHLFVLSAEGGAPRQLTEGPYNHRETPQWTRDGKHLIFSANRNKGWEHQPRQSEIYELSLTDGATRQVTNRKGPDTQPVVYPENGNLIAYLGFDDRLQGYQVTRLYVLDRQKMVSKAYPIKLDRSVRQPMWRYNVTNPKTPGSFPVPSVYFLFDDQGVTKIGSSPVSSLPHENLPVRAPATLADNIGGTTLGRPYASGSFSVSENGVIAYTLTDAQHPADVAVYDPKMRKTRRLTRLNDILFANKKLGTLEEIWYKSSHDDRKIQGWILKPPGFDPKQKYPLILEIHGGPFANYGPRFSAEMQLCAAAGYVVFYCNPRGSTSYGEEFGNLIHHNYPSEDYDDLMSGVDAVIKRGYVDADNLFITGGSGGGVLTTWTIGKTNRFRAAAAVNPVINWYSFVLTADAYPFFSQYWFPGPPWEQMEHYFKRSPISLVGNVKTPTMILTGEDDHRTPMSESEQYYQALKLRKVDAVLVRIPGASHNIAARPSQLMAKTACVLKWFDEHKK